MAIALREKSPGLWQVVDTRTDEVLLDDESYTVASNVQMSLALDRFIPGEECSEIAVAIVDHLRRRSASHKAVVDALEKLVVDFKAHHRNTVHRNFGDAEERASVIAARAALKIARGES